MATHKSREKRAECFLSSSIFFFFPSREDEKKKSEIPLRERQKESELGVRTQFSREVERSSWRGAEAQRCTTWGFRQRGVGVI